MNTTQNREGILCRTLIAAAVASILLAACATAPIKPDGAAEARVKLTQLQSDPDLASRAAVAIKDADAAVRAAEQPEADKELAAHRVYLADHKVDTARALAETRFAAELQRQIDVLHAKPTDRGLVLTLGNVLFTSGKADLQPGATGNLNKLVAFLNEYPGRTAAIQGYTDSVGSQDYNQSLSERRADSVKSYLAGQGIGSLRLSASGKGQSDPVAGNDSAAGRQQNRRVEVIISNPPAALR
jgi:outer membrane protein OmpA-like peptidoglycan-associated protein